MRTNTGFLATRSRRRFERASRMLLRTFRGTGLPSAQCPVSVLFMGANRTGQEQTQRDKDSYCCLLLRYIGEHLRTAANDDLWASSPSHGENRGVP
jgi:hypothetical protein